jgi:ATP/maltotriose-dependent transcriptional regulator MalT
MEGENMLGSADWHLDAQQASGLIANTLAPQERSLAVRHLLRGCGRCRALVAQSLAAEAPERRHDEVEADPSFAAHAVSFNAAFERMLASGRLAWEDLVKLPRGRRLEILKSNDRYHSFGVFKASLEAVRRRAHGNPAEAVELADLPLALAELIEPAIENQELRFDWRSDAASTLAEAKQAAGDFPGARIALEMAETFLNCGTGDEIDRAMLIVRQARLTAELGEFELAVAQLSTALPLFQWANDTNAIGKVLLHQALILRQIDPARALALAAQGLPMIDDARPKTELSARYTMAYCNNELGNADEAQRILENCQHLIRQFPDVATQCSIDWLRARICARQGRTAEAEQRLREVLGRYLAVEFRFEAVLTTVDLVELLVAQDRAAEGLYLVDEVLPILRAWGLHKDSIALVLLLAEHLQRKVVEAQTFRQVAERLRRTWHLNGATDWQQP